LPQFTRSEAVWDRRRRGTASRRAGHAENARVTIAWTPSIREVAVGCGRAVVELEALLGSDAGTTWPWREPVAPGWVEAISSAQCSEIVLTACLGDDAEAKHLVLALAERLTFELSTCRPLIRVLFQ